MTEFTVEGGDTFAATLNAAAAGLAHLDQAEGEAGRIVVMRAASLGPKLSGALANSVTADAFGDGVAVGSGLPYAGVTEFGGGNNIPAQPYLVPALVESTDQVLAAYTKGAQAELAKVKGA